MRIVECAREQDVLDALATGCWPARCGEDLRSHVAGCPLCGDLIEVAGVLLDDRDVMWSAARVPASGSMWWRAQIRARQEAARRAARPITAAQALAATVALALAATQFAVLSPSIGESMARLADIAAISPSRVPDVSRSYPWWWVAALVAGTWLVLTPVAVYFALTDD